MLHLIRSLVCFFAVVAIDFAADFAIGDHVQLVAQNPAGVPVRDHPGDGGYYRWPDKIVGVITGTQGNYAQVEVDTKRGWIHTKYLVAPASPVEEGTELPTITVAAWNLEHMHDGEARGFPELAGANALPPRTPSDYAAIATAIRDQLGCSVIMLSEIAGVPNQRTSVELDRLKALLGPNWQYAIGSSGGLNGAQRVAVLYDNAKVEALSVDELPVPTEVVDGSNIFDRDPLVGYFRVRRNGGPSAVDFLAVALHLASGQDKTANHDRAMLRFRDDLHAYCLAHPALQNEKDVIVGGDMNASRYDNKEEDFWTNFDASGFQFSTLSPVDGSEYLPTRLKGNPPFPGSQIDYLFASDHLKTVLTLPLATVHHELAANGTFLQYRRTYSDHFPISVSIVVRDDAD